MAINTATVGYLTVWKDCQIDREHFHMKVLREIVFDSFSQNKNRPTLNEVLEIIASDCSGPGGLVPMGIEGIDRENEVLYYSPDEVKKGTQATTKTWKFKTIQNRIDEIMKEIDLKISDIPPQH